MSTPQDRRDAKLRARYPQPEKPCNEAEFLRCVQKHKMFVLRDDGVFRHLRFKGLVKEAVDDKAAEYTFNQWFEVITWPETLCISGDMGTYVFQRLNDMFVFFRDEENRLDKAETLRVNLSYWAEKCKSADRDGVKQFDRELFQHQVWSQALDSEATKADLREIEERVISRAYDGEFAAMTAAIEFEADSGFRLSSFWETNCKAYTFSFVWICYAIAWAVKQYDASLNTETEIKFEDIRAGDVISTAHIEGWPESVTIVKAAEPSQFASFFAPTSEPQALALSGFQGSKVKRLKREVKNDG